MIISLQEYNSGPTIGHNKLGCIFSVQKTTSYISHHRTPRCLHQVESYLQRYRYHIEDSNQAVILSRHKHFCNLIEKTEEMESSERERESSAIEERELQKPGHNKAWWDYRNETEATVHILRGAVTNHPCSLFLFMGVAMKRDILVMYVSIHIYCIHDTHSTLHWCQIP